jgi:hypothetical protein
VGLRSSALPMTEQTADGDQLADVVRGVVGGEDDLAQ